MAIKKILVVCRHFWPENCRINDICEDFTAAGIQVDVLCGQPSNPAGNYYKGYNSRKIKLEKKGDINIYRAIDISAGQRTNVRMFFNYCIFPVTGLFKIRKLLKNGYDAVFMYQLSPVMMTLPGLILGRKLKIPKIMYVIDMWPMSLYTKLDIQSSLFQKFLQFLSMQHYRKADRLITISDKSRKYFMDQLGLSDDQVFKVPLSPEKIYEMHARNDDLLEKFAGSFNILIVGDASSNMSPETILGAAKLILAARIKHIRFIVLGMSDTIRKLKRMVNENGLHDYFYFEGTYKNSDIPEYTFLASAILCATKLDAVNEYSVPNQIINFLAAARPMLVSMGGASRELIKTAECGFSSEPEDAKGLFDNIMKLYKMPSADRAMMAMNAGRYQQEYFNRAANSSDIIRIINGDKTMINNDDTSSIKGIWDIESD